MIKRILKDIDSTNDPIELALLNNLLEYYKKDENDKIKEILVQQKEFQKIKNLQQKEVADEVAVDKDEEAVEELTEEVKPNKTNNINSDKINSRFMDRMNLEVDLRNNFKQIPYDTNGIHF
uniref:Uncharacterized protein n=1 Tax=viral metagenome TaxID=1070528 RepID=A0A6C0BFZ0_9ZZZZ